MNCKGCTHFSTIADAEFLPVTEFENEIKRISELTNKIGLINILGGEPLLNPNCTQYLEIARKYFPDTNINLVTNGILITSQKDTFFEKLSQYNITLAPTKYPIKIKWEKVKNLCKKHNVNLKFYNDEKVLKTSYKIPLDITGQQNEQLSYIKCPFPGCVQLNRGKIYKCPIAAYIEHFNKYFNQNLEISEGDYIDIYKAQNIQEILDFLIRPIPFCRHCVNNKIISEMQWGISSKKIEEWII